MARQHTRGRGAETGPVRHGGPGASHEDATEPVPEKPKGSPDKPDRESRHSRISGGGGETDIHHTRDPRTKS